MGVHAVTKQQDGRTLVLRVGDLIVLQLAENPASGYRWALGALDDSLVALESASYSGEDARPGSGGFTTWKLRARAAGRTQLRLKHWRHWAGDASIIDRFSLALDITPARTSRA